MIPENVLPFHYKIEKKEKPITAWAGLPLIMGLFYGMGLDKSIDKYIGARPEQGYRDAQQILSLILLNLVGGNAVEQLNILDSDAGLRKMEQLFEDRSMARRTSKRWRKDRERGFPSPTAMRAYLATFENTKESLKRGKGKAFIPRPNEYLSGFIHIMKEMLAWLQKRDAQVTATLDQDATLIETSRKEALYGYKNGKSYQPFNTYWSERNMMIHTEFRDGNVPAGYEQLRVFIEALKLLPEGVEKVRLRSDTAGYQIDLLRYCAEGKDKRFGVIDFAISHPVHKKFRNLVRLVPEKEWHPIYRTEGKGRNAKQVYSDQEYAEIYGYVPTGLARSKNGQDYRFFAIREVFSTLEDEDIRCKTHDMSGQRDIIKNLEQETPELSKLHLEKMDKTIYKVFSMVSNMDWDGEKLIHWQRKRCGKSEEVHSILKSGLAGGHIPSKLFGANAAWWWISVLAMDLQNILKRHVLLAGWDAKQPKAMRAELYTFAGRFVNHARRWILKLQDSSIARILQEGEWELDRFCRLQT